MTDIREQLLTKIDQSQACDTFEQQLLYVRYVFEFIELHFKQLSLDKEFMKIVNEKSIEALDHYDQYLLPHLSDEEYDSISETLQAAHRVYIKTDALV